MRIRVKCPKCEKSSIIEVPTPIQSKGGKARMAKITPEERRKNALKAAETRRKNREKQDQEETECR